MSSPITSVPDPAEGGAASNDPLAGVITQVSPRQAAAPVRGGPARPTKVAKQGTTKTANAAGVERKKKTKQSTATNEEKGKAGEGNPASEGVVAGEGEVSASHSAHPSSTLVGTTTTYASTLTPAESGDGISKDNANTGTTPLPAPAEGKTAQTTGVTSQQDMTEAAEKLSKTSPSGNNAALPKEKIEMSEKKGVDKPASSKSKQKRVKPSMMAKLLAFLTCSSAAGGMVAAEAQEERGASGSGRKKDTANGIATKGVKGKGLPASQRPSLDKSPTPGGGTRLPKEETGDVMSGSVVPPGSSFVAQDGEAGGKRGAGMVGVPAHKHDSDEDEDDDDDDEWMGDDQMQEDDDQTEEQRLIMQGGMGIPTDEDGNPHPLLEPVDGVDVGRKCLVLDLDETLVHSSFKMISNADFIVPVEIEGTVHNVYVIKRPGVDEFMRRMGEIYEVVVFTASLSKYADPVLDILDIHQVVRHRLFRESCYNHKGNYVKDLSQLGREIETSIIIDNSPASYIFHPNNAVPISSWFNDPHDTELTDLCPFLAELADVDDVRAVLDGGM